MTRLDYPSAPTGDDADDPYRALEQPDQPQVASWIAGQNALTESVLSAVPSRGAIRRRLTELWDYPKASAPFEHGGRWFQFRNSGLQAQSALYVTSSPTDEGRVLIDPNTMSSDGTVSVTSLGVSSNGELVAYATSSAGSSRAISPSASSNAVSPEKAVAITWPVETSACASPTTSSTAAIAAR